METIVFVGAGSIAEAMIRGIVGSGIMDPKNVFVMNKSDNERLVYLNKKYGVSIVCSERTALTKADLIILATKPKGINKVMSDISPFLKNDAAVLSVLTGISFEAIKNGLGARAIAKSVPNTSSTIGKSASGVAWNELVSPEMKESILNIFEAIGIVKEVDEDGLHTVTAISGSGPAYVYYFVEALEEAAVEQGFAKETARDLIIQTLEGAAMMLKVTGIEPAELRKNVTSPGGTTEAGLKALENRSFKKAISECVENAGQRSRELGKLS